MKTYHGVMGSDGARVVVEDPGGPRFIWPEDPAVGFAWGRTQPPHPPVSDRACTQLTMAILLEHLGGDRNEAARLYQRVKHRTVMTWTPDKPWRLTEKEIVDHIAQINEIEKASEGERRRVAMQPPPVAAVATMAGMPILRSRQDQGPDDGRRENDPRAAPVDPRERLAALEAAKASLTPEQLKALGLA